MDCKTGEIHYFSDTEQAKAMEETLGRKLKSLSDSEERQLRPWPLYKRKNNMRNRRCPCGSHKKFKKCCWSKYS